MFLRWARSHATLIGLAVLSTVVGVLSGFGS